MLLEPKIVGEKKRPVVVMENMVNLEKILNEENNFEQKH